MAQDGPSAPSPSTILVVDDDEKIRAMLRRVLENASFEVLDAADGRQAMRTLDEHAIDLIITDIIMPDTEGIELITRVRGRFATLPIIAMSGGGWIDPDPYLALARTLGANRVMAKPLNLSDLLDACAQLLDRAVPPNP